MIIYIDKVIEYRDVTVGSKASEHSGGVLASTSSLVALLHPFIRPCVLSDVITTSLDSQNKRAYPRNWCVVIDAGTRSRSTSNEAIYKRTSVGCPRKFFLKTKKQKNYKKIRVSQF